MTQRRPIVFCWLILGKAWESRTSYTVVLCHQQRIKTTKVSKDDLKGVWCVFFCSVTFIVGSVLIFDQVCSFLSLWLGYCRFQWCYRAFISYRKDCMLSCGIFSYWNFTILKVHILNAKYASRKSGSNICVHFEMLTN